MRDFYVSGLGGTKFEGRLAAPFECAQGSDPYVTALSPSVAGEGDSSADRVERERTRERLGP